MPREELALLSFVLLLGLLARAWHLTWSLPEMYEEAYPFAIAWKFWHWGEPGITLNPDFFHYPALTFYLQFALQAVHYAVGHLSGAYADLEAFRIAYERDPTIFIASARGLSAAFDLGAILLLHAIASRLFGRAAAFIAALAMAVSPLLVMQAQLVGVDTPMMFFVLLAFAAMMRLRETPAPRWYLLSGAAIGLAAAAKYNGALLAAPLLLSHAWRAAPGPGGRNSAGAGRLFLALGSAAAVFLLLNPHILLHFPQFQEDFSYERRHMAGGHLGLDAGQSSFAYYLLDALPRFLGWPLLAAAGLGMSLGAVRKNRELLLTSLFPLLYLAVIGSWEMRAERYLLPVVPFLILSGAAVVAVAWERIADAAGSRAALRTAGGALLFVFVLASPVAQTLSYHAAIGLPDTRTRAKEWILNAFPGDAAIVTGPFGMRIPKERYTQLLIPFSPTGSEALAPFYDPRWYEDLDLLIASDYDHGRFLLEPERYRTILSHFERLRAEWTLAAEFLPGDSLAGPAVRLYRRPGATAERFDASLFDALSAIAETSLVVRFEENLATALFAKGKIGQCGQLVDASLALAPARTRLVNSFAWTLFREKRYGEALAMADRSLAAGRAQAEMAGLRGSILLRMGNDREAETELLRAVALDSRLEIPYLDLELLYRSRNDRAGQIRVLKRYLAALPAGSENALRTDVYLRQLEGR